MFKTYADTMCKDHRKKQIKQQGPQLWLHVSLYPSDNMFQFCSI